MFDKPPNFALPTLGGKQLWGDLIYYGGYRVQENAITRHCRVLGPDDARLAWGTFDSCHRALERIKYRRRVRVKRPHLVLVLHGMFRSKDSMAPMTRGLQAAGFEAADINYPSTRRRLESHADQVEHVLNFAEDVKEVSFVCHSMGGLVARLVLARANAPWRSRLKVNRLVMIATPNQGSHMARRLIDLEAFQMLAGPVAEELLPEFVQQNIPMPTCPFGIVAGVRGTGRGFNPLHDGEDDFTVTLGETRLHGAEDTLVVAALHTFVMVKPEVIRATIRYLETGRFTGDARLG